MIAHDEQAQAKPVFFPERYLYFFKVWVGDPEHIIIALVGKDDVFVVPVGLLQCINQVYRVKCNTGLFGSGQESRNANSHADNSNWLRLYKLVIVMLFYSHDKILSG